MKKEDIHLNDWQRIFFGDVPGGFYWEVVLRISIVYLVLMVSMRLMGKRMASQLSRNEMIALVSLAAAIGVPLQAPDRGILAAVVIAAVVVAVQQITAKIASRNEQLEAITQGAMSILVADGHLDLKAMVSTGITRERVFAVLRNDSVRHLGEIKRLYFEAGGSFSTIREIEEKPGLCILPECDAEFIKEVCENTEETICKHCGFPAGNGNTEHKCENCHADEFTQAVR